MHAKPMIVVITLFVQNAIKYFLIEKLLRKMVDVSKTFIL